MKNRSITGIKPATIATTLLFITAASAHAIITVTNTNDGGPGSLRAAIAAANDGDTIDATGVSGTILLTSGELLITKNVTINGPGAAKLAVNGNAKSRVFHISAGETVLISGLTIKNGFASGPFPANQGGGIWNDHAVLTLKTCKVTGNSSSGGNGGGIINDAFDHGSATLEIDNCTISNNSALCAPGCPDGGGIDNIGGNGSAVVTVTNSTISGNSAGYDGGGIANGDTLTISNSTISDNSAGGHGGGIYSTGVTLMVSDSIISGNSVTGGGGGGIFNDYGGTPTVINSTISGNSSVQGGGGIASFARSSGPLMVSNSTITGNSYTQADQGGGGIANAGDAIVINSSISGNSGPNVGGGIANFSNSLTVKNCTFSGNSANGNNGNGGGAIFNWTGGTTQIGGSVLNTGAFGGTLFDNSGTITSLGYNLASDNGGGFLTATGDQVNTDPMLGPLQDNGGPTFTHALLPGSPAIDAGDPNFTPPPDFDQRGSAFPRVVNGRIDIGSFEVHAIYLANISTRLAVGTGDNVLIAGFILSGNGNKPVLLRALGPTLGHPPFNVPGTLADPILYLYDSHGILLASNDNWKDAPNAQSIEQSLRPPNDSESAILTTLAPGSYTAVVRGANNITGVALVEAYDLELNAPVSLTNVSTRGFVQTGADVMIGGVIISGADSTQILVRALGPTIGRPPFNVPNVLADPYLELHNGNGDIISVNNNWRDTQQTAIQTTGLAPSDNLESAVLSTLPAGNYTGIVRGADGGMGNALVEFYKLNIP